MKPTFFGMMFNQDSLPVNRLVPALVVVLTLAAYLSGMFVHVTRDSSKYATVAREMAETGDLIHLKVHGEPYLQKPPMIFWLSAISLSLFGLTDFAFRLPLMLLSLAGLFFTYRLGKSLYGKDVGLIAAFLLGTSQVFFLYNMDIHTDSVLLVFVVFSLWQFHAFLRTDKNIHLIGGFIGTGLAMLTKGPAGAAIPAFAVVGYLLMSGNAKKLTDWRWYAGTLLSFSLLTPALVGLYRQFGWEGIRFFFWENNAGRLAGRFTSNDFNPFFYVVNIFPMFLPWMMLLLFSIFQSFRSLFRRTFHHDDWFLFCGTWIFFLILSLSMDKLPNYVYPLMPLFALTTAKYVNSAVSGSHPALWGLFKTGQAFAFFLTFAVAILVSAWFFPPEKGWQMLLLLLLGGVSIFLFFRLKERMALLLYPSALLVAGLNVFVNGCVAPQIFRDQAPVKAALIFNTEAGEGERLYNYNYFSHELFFYGKIPVTQLRNDVTLIGLMQKPGTWVLTTGEVKERIWEQIPEPEVTPLPHVWVNKLNFRYFNPATRAASRDTLYLLRSRNK